MLRLVVLPQRGGTMIKVGEKIPDIEAFHEEHPSEVPSKLGTEKNIKSFFRISRKNMR